MVTDNKKIEDFLKRLPMNSCFGNYNSQDKKCRKCPEKFKCKENS